MEQYTLITGIWVLTIGMVVLAKLIYDAVKKKKEKKKEVPERIEQEDRDELMEEFDKEEE